MNHVRVHVKHAIRESMLYSVKKDSEGILSASESCDFFICTFLSMWKASQLPGAAARTWVQQQVSIRRRPGHLDHQLDQTTFVRSHHHLSFSLVLGN